MPRRSRLIPGLAAALDRLLHRAAVPWLPSAALIRLQDEGQRRPDDDRGGPRRRRTAPTTDPSGRPRLSPATAADWSRSRSNGQGEASGSLDTRRRCIGNYRPGACPRMFTQVHSHPIQRVTMLIIAQTSTPPFSHLPPPDVRVGIKSGNPNGPTILHPGDFRITCTPCRKASVSEGVARPPRERPRPIMMRLALATMSSTRVPKFKPRCADLEVTTPRMMGGERPRAGPMNAHGKGA